MLKLFILFGIITVLIFGITYKITSIIDVALERRTIRKRLKAL